MSIHQDADNTKTELKETNSVIESPNVNTKYLYDPKSNIN